MKKGYENESSPMRWKRTVVKVDGLAKVDGRKSYFLGSSSFAAKDLMVSTYFIYQ